jgi:hypothetical protein
LRRRARSHVEIGDTERAVLDELALRLDDVGTARLGRSSRSGRRDLGVKL